jgi:hypothetical protein
MQLQADRGQPGILQNTQRRYRLAPAAELQAFGGRLL